ncbi:MAG TPA: futalosine hydrolase [Bacteroidales bacterium]|nr:futalosine hydrolase [Bacteroidales bacterium]HPJ59837.1 futalosine hydrolase [Bacteroidales bacterium]HPR12715.1 futalosine hydrolase [Bacteroidales bacterium]
MIDSILLVFATAAEADSMKKIPGIRQEESGIFYGNTGISVLVTGVGAMNTSWEMAKWIRANSIPGLAINAGIAGSYRNHINKGDVVMPVRDCFADAGIESESGFSTLAESGLADPDGFPFRDGWLEAENEYVTKALALFRPVNAITVNTASGSLTAITRLTDKYNPDIETMEGATFFYICIREKIPFLAMRSVSNRVEPRNVKNWDIPLALENLSEKLKELLHLLCT